MRITCLAAPLVFVFASATASAGQIIAQMSGLSGTDHVQDFGANLYPNFTVITTEFPGLTVGHARYFTTGSVNNLVGGFLTNDFSGAPDTLSIKFDTPITDLSFAYHQIGTFQPSVYRAMLGGVTVDTFSNLSDQYQPNNYFGFTDLVFDELQIDFVSDFNIDTLAYNDAGSIGVLYCFGDPGSGTPCPCGNDNDGSVPQSGCANGVFASGAQLTASGDPSLGADTLVLATTGTEPSNSGLYFQANNDLSPGLVWGDGLQCAGGQLKRLGVRFSDANGYSDTSGFAQPISVKAGNIVAGDTKYYQLWYRNPISSPCTSDFNSSNGLAITWGP